ncbi:hypothetical protein GCM10010360_21670 [Streptomyces nogalater]
MKQAGPGTKKIMQGDVRPPGRAGPVDLVAGARHTRRQSLPARKAVPVHLGGSDRGRCCAPEGPKGGVDRREYVGCGKRGAASGDGEYIAVSDQPLHISPFRIQCAAFWQDGRPWRSKYPCFLQPPISRPACSCP